MIKLTQLYCLSIVLFWYPVLGQPSLAKKDFEKVNAAYGKLPNLKVELDYLLFAGHTSKSVLERQIGKVEKKGHLNRYQLGPIETFHTNKYTLSIDRESKIMIIDHRKGNIQPPFTGYNMEEFLSICEKITAEPLDNHRFRYSLFVPMDEMERIDIIFDTNTYLLKQLSLYYRYEQEMEFSDGSIATGKPRIEIHYRQLNKNPVFTKDAFSIDRYVKLRDGVVEPINEFKQFQFIDYTKFKFN